MIDWAVRGRLVVRVAAALAVVIAAWLWFWPTKVLWEQESGTFVSFGRVNCGTVFTSGPNESKFDGVDGQCRAAEVPKLVGGIGLLVLAGAGLWVSARASDVRGS